MQTLMYLEAVIITSSLFLLRLNKPSPFRFSFWGFTSVFILEFSKCMFMYLGHYSTFSLTRAQLPLSTVLDLQLGYSIGLRRAKGHLPAFYRLFFYLSMTFDFHNHVTFWLLFKKKKPTSWSASDSCCFQLPAMCTFNKRILLDTPSLSWKQKMLSHRQSLSDSVCTLSKQIIVYYHLHRSSLLLQVYLPLPGLWT